MREILVIQPLGLLNRRLRLDMSVYHTDRSHGQTANHKTRCQNLRKNPHGSFLPEKKASIPTPRAIPLVRAPAPGCTQVSYSRHTIANSVSL